MQRLDYRISHGFSNSATCKVVVSLLASALVPAFRIGAQAQTSVTTYHNDTLRTGWNPTETILTALNVTSTTFGLIRSVALDDQVDAQPLVVADQTIAGKGTFNAVVYVATENNTVYAIDSATGKILVLNDQLGPPVRNPLNCHNHGPNLGIGSTPTIDVAKQTIYVMAYTKPVGGKPTYQLHALDLKTLQDQPRSPITVSASHRLVDGSIYNFKPGVEVQRPALLESGGNIYAGFGSFCDFSAGRTRGWLLGWNAGSLLPLSANELTDTLKTAPSLNGNNYFLSSIWMSGAGPADDGAGNILFVTGNSDRFLNTYTGTTNIQESVVRMPEALSGVLDLFTPSNVFTLDQNDWDLGAGGVLLLPDQPGLIPHLAVAAGKDGRLFIMNRDFLGGFKNPDIPAHVTLGPCWCAESYYQGSNGIGRVVTSGNNKVKMWTVNTAVSPALTNEATSAGLVKTSQDGGFFTSVSSNGMNPKTAIIWAIQRPSGTDNHITLYAFNGTKSGTALPLLWSSPGTTAGFWPVLSANANLVPTVGGWNGLRGQLQAIGGLRLDLARSSGGDIEAAFGSACAEPCGCAILGQD
jgi:hypothetical protein